MAWKDEEEIVVFVFQSHFEFAIDKKFTPEPVISPSRASGSSNAHGGTEEKPGTKPIKKVNTLLNITEPPGGKERMPWLTIGIVATSGILEFVLYLRKRN